MILPKYKLSVHPYVDIKTPPLNQNTSWWGAKEFNFTLFFRFIAIEANLKSFESQFFGLLFSPTVKFSMNRHCSYHKKYIYLFWKSVMAAHSVVSWFICCKKLKIILIWSWWLSKIKFLTWASRATWVSRAHTKLLHFEKTETSCLTSLTRFLHFQT